MPKKSSTIGALSFNGSQFAELIGVSPGSISGWRRQGLPTNADGTIPAQAGIKWFIDKEILAAGGNGDSASLERWRLARAQREELALARDRGLYLARDEVAAFFTDRIVAARQQMRGVGQAAAPACVGLAVEQIAERIDDRLRAICRDMERDWHTALGGDPADLDDEEGTADVGTK